MNDQIRELEVKMLPSKKRDRGEHPAKVLTPIERNIYAEYLESKNDLQGAASFRNYVEPVKTEKVKKGRKRK